MGKVWAILFTVVAVLLLERLTITLLLRSPKRQRWIRAHPLFHPNTISLIRIPMGVVSVLLWLAGMKVAAILWFSVWMLTDLTDGTIARSCDLTTERGKWLDPLSDKCMYFPTLILLAVLHVLPAFWVVLLLITDTVGQSSRLFTKKKAANYFGKAKTALITVLLALAGLQQIHELWFMSRNFVDLLTISSVILAFLSFYCKLIPDAWYANSLTLANFTCGLVAIWYIARGHPLRGFILIFMGQFFDLFDGRLAKIFGSTRHGPVFDDFADGTSFGLAIGFLILHELRMDSVPLLGHGLATLYFACVVFRLYRFLHPAVPLPKGIFSGLPSPAGAMLAGSAVLLFGENLPAIAALTVLGTSALMVSTIRYRHFGYRIWPGLPNSIKLMSFVVLLVFVNITIADKDYKGSFTIFCFAMASIYVLYGTEHGIAGGQNEDIVPQHAE